MRDFYRTFYLTLTVALLYAMVLPDALDAAGAMLNAALTTQKGLVYARQ